MIIILLYIAIRHLITTSWCSPADRVRTCWPVLSSSRPCLLPASVGQHGGSWLGGLTRGRAAQIQHDFNRNKYFDTSEALEYGIIDRVIKPPRTRVLGV